MSGEEKSILQVIVELRDEVTEPLRKISEQFEEVSNSARGLFAAGLEVFAGYEAIEGLLEPAIAFAQVQERLALATHGNAQELAELKEQAEELSQAFPKNIEDITQAQTELFQSFRNMEDTKAATEVATRLATALGTDAATGANILSSAIENLGEKGKPLNEQLESLGDKLAILRTYFPSGAAGAQRMAIELSRLGAAAQTTGIHQNQIFAVWAELNRLHAGGGRGSGQLAEQIIQSLTKLNEKGVPELAKYGLAVVKATDGSVNLYATLKKMSEMSPKALLNLEQHMSGQGAMVALLVKHLDDVNSAYGEFLHHDGELEKISSGMANTPQANLERLKNSLSNLGDTIGTTMLPQLAHVVDGLNEFLKGLNAFLGAHPRVTKALGDIAVGLAGLLTAVGLVKFGQIGIGLVKLAGDLTFIETGLSMLGNAWKAMAFVATYGIESIGAAAALLFESNPIGWTITALAVVALLSYEIYKHWDDIVKTIHDCVEGFKEIVHILPSMNAGQWGHTLADLAGGNIAGAVNEVAMAGVINGSTTTSSSESHLHYSPTVTVNVGHGVDASGVGSAVHHALSNHAEGLDEALKEQQHQHRRTSFLDPTLQGAY
jgi:TP901 family phage tail tape measure protein